MVRPGEQAGGLRLSDRLFPALRERTGAALEYSRGITNVGSPGLTNTDVCFEISSGERRPGQVRSNRESARER